MGRTFSKDGRTKRECEVCGDGFVAKMAAQRACGRLCGYYLQHGRWPQSKVKTTRPDPAPKSCRVFITDCVICGTVFATPYTVSTCSADCAEVKKRGDRQTNRDRRRALQRDAFVEKVYRRRVYERDRWRCHLCGKKVNVDAVVPHPLAPTLDHVIPLAVGGKHEAANCRTAHYICNSRKGARGGGEQLLLIA